MPWWRRSRDRPLPIRERCTSSCPASSRCQLEYWLERCVPYGWHHKMYSIYSTRIVLYCKWSNEITIKSITWALAWQRGVCRRRKLAGRCRAKNAGQRSSSGRRGTRHSWTRPLLRWHQTSRYVRASSPKGWGRISTRGVRRLGSRRGRAPRWRPCRHRWVYLHELEGRRTELERGGGVEQVLTRGIVTRIVNGRVDLQSSQFSRLAGLQVVVVASGSGGGGGGGEVDVLRIGCTSTRFLNSQRFQSLQFGTAAIHVLSKSTPFIEKDPKM